VQRIGLPELEAELIETIEIELARGVAA
jgi:hypothetical protein